MTTKGIVLRVIYFFFPDQQQWRAKNKEKANLDYRKYVLVI